MKDFKKDCDSYRGIGWGEVGWGGGVYKQKKRVRDWSEKHVLYF